MAANGELGVTTKLTSSNPKCNSELHRFDQPSLCVVVLCRPSNKSEVLLLNFMCIHKSATALLLDGERVSARRYEYPPLVVVVFRLAGNECEVMSRTFIGVHKSAIALLLNGAHHSNRS